MFRRAGAQHGVGIDHSIGFRPGDHLVGRGRGVQQIGRAGKAGPATHTDIGIGQLLSGDAEIRSHALCAPVLSIDGNGIHRGGYADATAQLGHLPGKGQIGRAGIDAAVDMALGYIDQTLCPLTRGHGADDLHRLLGRHAGITGQHRPVRR